jgi:hypothetical protein
MVPSRERVEEYLNELDEWAWRKLQSATADVPSLNAITNRIWADISRFGTPQIPGLGVFDIPPKLPPPPPDPGLIERTGDWIVSHKLKALGLGICFAIGSGLLAGYVYSYMRTSQVKPKTKSSNKKKERKEVAGKLPIFTADGMLIEFAVVLGADIAFGFQLVLELESRGFIVIATVSKSDTIEEIESNGNGYIRALVLDPTEV